MPRSKLRSVQRYLAGAEARSPERHWGDYRQAWLILEHLRRQRAGDPYLITFIQLYGCTPERAAQKRAAYHEFMLRPTMPRPKVRAAVA